MYLYILWNLMLIIKNYSNYSCYFLGLFLYNTVDFIYIYICIYMLIFFIWIFINYKAPCVVVELEVEESEEGNSETIPAAIVAPWDRNMNLPISLICSYNSRQTGRFNVMVTAADEFLVMALLLGFRYIQFFFSIKNNE